MEQIEIEKKREKDLKELKRVRGELLTNVRAALQSMSTMLFCVKQSGKSPKRAGAKEGNKGIPKESDDKEDAEERDTLLDFEEMDTDGTQRAVDC